MAPPRQRSRTKRSLPTARSIVDAARAARMQGDATLTDTAQKALATVGVCRVGHCRDITALHDELLFQAAFPASPKLRRAADDALSALALRITKLPQRIRRALDDTGIAQTTSRHTFMFGVAEWLARHGELAAIDWPAFADGATLDPYLRLSLTDAECAALDQEGTSIKEWLWLAARAPRADSPPDEASSAAAELAWLVSPPTGDHGGHAVDQASRAAYDSAEVPLTWELGNSPWSVTRLRAPHRRVECRSSFRKLPTNPVEFIRRPLSDVRPLKPHQARRWIDVCTAALSSRCREVSPTIYANANEVYLADLGAGCSLCILGSQPADRLPLEANYGYVLFSNGVPLGYGGVTPLAAQANTGINVFDAFRGSEVPYLFAQSMRVFRWLFETARFVVNPYQFGAGNDEALQSGAFWFYDRLGFRPTAASVRALADRERARIAADCRYRSDLPTLRALASCDLVLELDDAADVPRIEEALLPQLSRHVAAALAAIPARARARHLQQEVASIASSLGAPHRASRRSLGLGLRYLGPYLYLIRDAIEHWRVEDKLDLWRLIALKGDKHERLYAVAAGRHSAFWAALQQLTHVTRVR